MTITKPVDASPEVQKAFQDVEDALNQLLGALNVDLKGKRITNAGEAVSSGDYVTLGQAKKLFVLK